MPQDQQKVQVENPNSNTANSLLSFKDMSQEVPEVDDLLDEIDKLLVKTRPKEETRQRSCGC